MIILFSYSSKWLDLRMTIEYANLVISRLRYV